MSQFKRSVAVLLLVVLCVGCDQLTKGAAQQYLAFEPPHSWFHDTIRLEYAENRGAFLSLGGGLSKELRIFLFQVFPAIWLVALALYLLFARSPSMLFTVAWCLVLSGGAGNLLDRVLHDGHVVDFMNLGIGSLRTGIFNVADVCITSGVVLLIVQAVWPHQPALPSELQR
ncbi:MAG: signal peptidase II [Nitrospira sp.]|nr:signal peptidase II [Nitrospira sp.]